MTRPGATVSPGRNRTVALLLRATFRERLMDPFVLFCLIALLITFWYVANGGGVED